METPVKTDPLPPTISPEELDELERLLAGATPQLTSGLARPRVLSDLLKTGISLQRPASKEPAHYEVDAALFIAAVNALPALLALARSQAGWRTIDSAPKDGTHILACAGPYNKTWTFAHRPPCVIHYWDNPGEEGFYLSAGGYPDELAFQATHWMPLSAPPVNEGA